MAAAPVARESDPAGRGVRRLQFMNHMNLFAILKPLKNLNALFRKSARSTLQGSRDHA